MFCKNCGRPIEPGEICTCMQQNPVSGESSDDIPASGTVTEAAPAEVVAGSAPVMDVVTEVAPAEVAAGSAPVMDVVTESAPAEGAAESASTESPVTETSSGISLVLGGGDDPAPGDFGAIAPEQTMPVAPAFEAPSTPASDILPATPASETVSDAANASREESPVPEGNPVIRFLGSPLILLFALAELAKIVFDMITTINGTSVFCRVGIIPEYLNEGTGKVYSIGLVIVLSVLPAILVLAALITFINARAVGSSNRPMSSCGLSLFSGYCTARIVLDIAAGVLGCYMYVATAAASEDSQSLICLIPAVLVIIDLVYYFLLNKSVKGLRFNACNFGRAHRVSFVPAIVMMLLMIVEVLIAVSFHLLTYLLNAVSDVLDRYLNVNYIMNEMIHLPKLLRSFKFTSEIESSLSEFIDETTDLINKLIRFDKSEALNLWISIGISIFALVIAVIIVFKGRSAQKRCNNI